MISSYRTIQSTNLIAKQLAGIPKGDKNTDNMTLDGNIFWKQFANQYLKKNLYKMATCKHIDVLTAK